MLERINNLKVIDIELSKKLFGNKPDIILAIFQTLTTTLMQDVEQIVLFYKTNRHEELLKAVHRLHGALCYTPTPRLKEVVASLESDLKKDIIDTLPILITHLQDESAKVMQYQLEPAFQNNQEGSCKQPSGTETPS